MLINPFYLSANIPSKYFCDREKETERLLDYIINGDHVTLISPRRMGKSGLINHLFEQPAIKQAGIVTLYVDILQTSSLREFVYLFGKAVYDNIVPKTKKWTTIFFQILKSLTGKVSFDPISGYPSFNMSLGEISNPAFTLEEIFEFLKKFDRRCLISFDEFQQIVRYPEKNIEAILRSYIQQQNNASFIFSGSERHIMQEIFTAYSRPFFNSTAIMELGAIPEEIYMKFALKNFTESGKMLQEEGLRKLYAEFEGYTYYLQKTLHEAFVSTAPGRECKEKDLRNVLETILDNNSTIYREILSNIPERQKELLYAVAIEEKVEKPTSAEFIKKYNLLSPSSVQSAMKVLLDKDYISHIDGKYLLTDKFFSLWIKRLYGPSPFRLL